MSAPFLPMTRAEMEALNWDELDILLITGDCYVDHPSFGAAIIGRLLEHRGYKVGIVAQPDWSTPESLRVMGRPRVGIGVTSGNIDSMVNLYTVGRRLRKEDAFSEDNIPGKRPPHATMVYAQLARQAFPGVPVMLGGIEASLRRIAHYDYWQDKIRPSVLVDAKAEILVYGMGERPTPEIFDRFRDGKTLEGIRGTARLLGKKAAESFDISNYRELPTYEETLKSKDALMTATKLVEEEMNPYRGCGLVQRYGDRLLVIEAPPLPLEPAELDLVHELPYARRPHPVYKKRIPAFVTIENSVQAIRGCPGACAFCGLVTHQGRTVMSRTQESIKREVETIAAMPHFKGTISDVGGAAGNTFGSVTDPEKCKLCHRASCLHPKICPNYHCDGKATVELLRSLMKIPKVKHVYINSGVRLDLALKQPELMEEMIGHHVSGHLKVAPEHLAPNVLRLMRKSSAEEFYEFMRRFEIISKEHGLEQYIIPLFISNFPGCTGKDMQIVDDFLNKHRWSLQQVQDYIPLPMTMGAAMYYTGKDSEGNPLQVQRGLAERRAQIEVLKKRRSGKDAPAKNNGSAGDRNTFNNRKKDNHGKFGNKKNSR